MAALVTRLKLVTAEGEVRTLSAADNNTDLFRAAQVEIDTYSKLRAHLPSLRPSPSRQC